MKYGRIDGIDKQVSRMVQGTAMIGSSQIDAGYALLDAAFERGCNTFDTAHVYGRGDNERTVGNWIRDRGIRDEVVVIAKGAHHSKDRRRVTPFDIASDLHDSLARFAFDNVDLYILHRDDPDVPVGPIVEALNEHIRAGRIRACGGSNWTHERIAEANEYADKHGLVGFAASSPNFSLAERIEEPWPGCISISGPGEREAREFYRRTQIPVVSWSSLAAGFFSGRIDRDNLDEWGSGYEAQAVRCYGGEENFKRLDRARTLAEEKGATVAQIAVAYIYNSGLNAFPIFGPQTIEEFEENAAALEIDLSDEEIAWLELEPDARYA